MKFALGFDFSSAPFGFASESDTGANNCSSGFVFTKTIVLNWNKSEHAAKTMPTMKSVRNQVAVAGTLAKKKTYLTTWLHSGCDPKWVFCEIGRAHV